MIRDGSCVGENKVKVTANMDIIEKFVNFSLVWLR